MPMNRNEKLLVAFLGSFILFTGLGLVYRISQVRNSAMWIERPLAAVVVRAEASARPAGRTRLVRVEHGDGLWLIANRERLTGGRDTRDWVAATSRRLGLGPSPMLREGTWIEVPDWSKPSAGKEAP